MTTPTEVLHVRLPKALVKAVDHWAIDADMKFRQDSFAYLLRLGLRAAAANSLTTPSTSAAPGSGEVTG